MATKRITMRGARRSSRPPPRSHSAVSPQRATRSHSGATRRPPGTSSLQDDSDRLRGPGSDAAHTDSLDDYRRTNGAAPTIRTGPTASTMGRCRAATRPIPTDSHRLEDTDRRRLLCEVREYARDHPVRPTPARSTLRQRRRGQRQGEDRRRGGDQRPALHSVGFQESSGSYAVMPAAISSVRGPRSSGRPHRSRSPGTS